MSDLISREEVIKLIQQYHGYMPNHINHEMYKKAKEIPTAYDADKVVEQLEDACCKDIDGMELPIIDYDITLEIVKGAVKDE